MKFGDDTIVYYHRACGWIGEPIMNGAMVNECPRCRARNVLSFVTYKSGTVEAGIAETLILREVGADKKQCSNVLKGCGLGGLVA